MSLHHLETLFSLRGKIALITGASSGLGIEFARGLAMAGADVAIIARRLERLQVVADELERLGVRSQPILSSSSAFFAAIRPRRSGKSGHQGCAFLLRESGNVCFLRWQIQ